LFHAIVSIHQHLFFIVLYFISHTKIISIMSCVINCQFPEVARVLVVLLNLAKTYLGAEKTESLQKAAQGMVEVGENVPKVVSPKTCHMLLIKYL
jgi:hypothetical protein